MPVMLESVACLGARAHRVSCADVLSLEFDSQPGVKVGKFSVTDSDGGRLTTIHCCRIELHVKCIGKNGCLAVGLHIIG